MLTRLSLLAAPAISLMQMKDRFMWRLRFGLRMLFLLMANACVVVWAAASISYREVFYPIPAAVVFVSLTCAIYGLSLGQRPIVLGAIGGFLGAATTALCFCALHGIGYFFYEGPMEYFEDGVFFELVFAPPVYVVVWGAFGALAGAGCGALVWAAHKTFTTAKLRQKADPWI